VHTSLRRIAHRKLAFLNIKRVLDLAVLHHVSEQLRQDFGMFSRAQLGDECVFYLLVRLLEFTQILRELVLLCVGSIVPLDGHLTLVGLLLQLLLVCIQEVLFQSMQVFVLVGYFERHVMHVFMSANVHVFVVQPPLLVYLFEIQEFVCRSRSGQKYNQVTDVKRTEHGSED